MEKKKKAVLWGLGPRCEGVLKTIDYDDYDVEAIIDNNENVQGKQFFGIPVYSYEYLKKNEADIIVLCLGKNGTKSVISQLKQEGFDVRNVVERTYFMKMKIMDFYKDSEDKEIQRMLKYLDHHELGAFNYEFVDKYKNMEIECFFDEKAKLWYVLEDEKKMYMKRSLDTKEKVEDYYKSICIEQDLDSPHRYIVDGYEVKEGMTVIDAGVAEGNFALSVIEKVKKIYLVECDSEWIEALKHTFAEYADKVVYVNKYLSDKVADNMITIDEIAKEDNIDYIKMDIEGAEVSALEGADKVLQGDIKLNICSYHHEDDEEKIREILENADIKTENSKGYMCFLYDENGMLYRRQVHKFVRGLIRGSR